MAKSPTRTSTPRLSEIAREVRVPPSAVRSGWPAVEAKCRDLGVRFRPWQPGVGRIILAKNADGLYAATIGGTGLSIPRQVGKTFLVGAIVFALCLLRPNLTVIWTAHRLRTAAETFGKMQAFAKRKRVRPFIVKITTGNSDEAIQFINGSRILFGARESGFGLGFDEIDVLIFDEAQRLKDSTLDDMIPATNQCRQPTGALLLFLGTPPRPTDNGEVFTRMRADALSGDDEDTAWVEFGADPGFEPTPAPGPMTAADWEQIAKANPSFPADTPRAAILRMRKKLAPESLAREGYGIWDEDGAVGVFGPKWGSRVREDSEILDQLHFGLALSLDRERFAIAAAGVNAAGLVHVELTHEPGSDRVYAPKVVVAECVRLQQAHGAPFVIDNKGTASSLIPALRQAGVEVVEADTSGICDAFADMFDRVRAGDVVHLADAELDASIKAARTRKVGERLTLARRESRADSSPAEAAMLAAWPVEKRPPELTPSFAYQ